MAAKAEEYGSHDKTFVIPEALGDGHVMTLTRWWQLKYLFIFIPKLGEDEPILTIIFFRWVETTN